ncbi:MAG: hypothetical protein VB022_00820 [Rikenellaceae bacterium]|nr:hypothetical protein [Rikenellaceae bacterium]
MKLLYKVTSCLAAVLISTCVFAQDGNNAPKKTGMPERPSDEQIARMMTDEMKIDLGLTDIQYKKIYKINLQLIKKQTAENSEKQIMPSNDDMKGEEMGMQGPMGGGPMGGGPMGGGPMGGSSMRGSKGGKPAMEKSQNLPPVPYRESVETLEVKANKFKKILTPEQYNKWIKKEREKLNKEFWDTNPNKEISNPTSVSGKKSA